MSGIAGRRLLVADDQALVRDAICRVLRNRNIHLDLAEDGEAAIRLLNGRTRYSAAVLDQRMPGVSGLEVVKLVRSGRSKASHELPMLLITGHGETSVIRAAAELEIDAVLAKPFTTKTFLDRLEKTLAGQPLRKNRDAYARVDLPSSRQAGHCDALAPELGDTAPPGNRNPRQGGAAGNGPRQLVSVSHLAEGMVLGQALYSGDGSSSPPPVSSSTALRLPGSRTWRWRSRATDMLR